MSDNSADRADRVARSHQQRDVAESFGQNAERYDRSRPDYPRPLIERIVGCSRGRDLLDVGCGTGIPSRLFLKAGFRVLGLDPDQRMAALAAHSGLQVEAAKFEDWDAGGRAFDVVVAAQAWHWIDPATGANKLSEVLRRGGRAVLFWNAADVPRDLRSAFADVYERVLPEIPEAGHHYRRADSVADAYSAFLDRAAQGLNRTASFGEMERWRYDWDRWYTRDQWLDQVPTQGGHNLMSPTQQEALLAGLAAAIDAAGGGFNMNYATLALTAVKLA